MSGVPVYLWWLSTPPFGSAELNDCFASATLLVVDSSRFDGRTIVPGAVWTWRTKSHPHMASVISSGSG